MRGERGAETRRVDLLAWPGRGEADGGERLPALAPSALYLSLSLCVRVYVLVTLLGRKERNSDDELPRALCNTMENREEGGQKEKEREKKGEKEARETETRIERVDKRAQGRSREKREVKGLRAAPMCHE